MTDAGCNDVVLHTVISNTERFSFQNNMSLTGGDPDLSNVLQPGTQLCQKHLNCIGECSTDDNICITNCCLNELSPGHSEDLMSEEQSYQLKMNTVRNYRPVQTDERNTETNLIVSCNDTIDSLKNELIERRSPNKTMRSSRNMSVKKKQDYNSSNMSSEMNRSMIDEESLLDSSDSFGESHVNKLMSFVESLERKEFPTAKSLNSTVSKSMPGISTPEKNLMSVGKKNCCETPFAHSLHGNFTSSNVLKSNCNPSTPDLVVLEQPLDLSINRVSSDNRSRLSRGFNGEDVRRTFDEQSAQFNNELTRLTARSNISVSTLQLSDRLRGFEPRSITENIHWSPATSSLLPSLQAQMEAVIMSYPIFKASLQLCQNMMNPSSSEQVKTEPGSLRSHHDSKRLRDNGVCNMSPEMSKVKQADNVTRRSQSNNRKLRGNVQRFSQSSDVICKAKPYVERFDRSVKRSPIVRTLSAHKKLTVPYECPKYDIENDRGTFSDSSRSNTGRGGHVKTDTARPLTSLSCSCRRQFSTLYQLTVHMKNTGHGPSMAGDSSSEDFPKLVRGQDLWMSLGQSQKDRTLSCMHCHASFQSLAELTVHMVKTKHYVDIVSHENRESTQKLLDSEVLLKLQQTLRGNQRTQGESSMNAKNICTQCRASFMEPDDLSEHLFFTGHQMLCDVAVETHLSGSQFRESTDERSRSAQDRDNSTDSGLRCSHSRKQTQVKHITDILSNKTSPNISFNAKPTASKRSENVTRKTQKVVCRVSDRQSSLKYSKYCAKNTSQLECSNEMRIDVAACRNGNTGRNASLDMGLKMEIDHNNTELSVLHSTAKRLKRQKRATHKTSEYKKIKLENSNKEPHSLQANGLTSNQHGSWKEAGTNSRFGDQSSNKVDQNPNNEEKNCFMNLIYPPDDVLDSSSTLRAMESFVERSFLLTNNISSKVTETSLLKSELPRSTNSFSRHPLYPKHLKADEQSSSLTTKIDSTHDGTLTTKPIHAHSETEKNLTSFKSETTHYIGHSPVYYQPFAIQSPVIPKQQTKIKNEFHEIPAQTIFEHKIPKPETEIRPIECSSSSNTNSSVQKHEETDTKQLVHCHSDSDDVASSDDITERVNVTDSKTSVQTSYTSSTLQYLQLFVDDTMSNTSQSLQLDEGSFINSVADVGKISIKT